MPAIKKWITEWEKEALKIIREEIKRAEAKYAGWGIARVRADYQMKADFPDDTYNLILDLSGKLHTLDYKEAGTAMMAFLGDDPFNMDNADVIAYLKDKTGTFTKEQATRLSVDLEAVLKEGITEGHTVAEITATIKEKMGWEMEGYRAERIARTEVISASNRARSDAFVQGGVPRKSWSSARSPGKSGTLREDHLAYDYQTSANPIPSGDEFVLPSGSRGMEPVNMDQVGENINCRCSSRPEQEE